MIKDDNNQQVQKIAQLHQDLNTVKSIDKSEDNKDKILELEELLNKQEQENAKLNSEIQIKIEEHKKLKEDTNARIDALEEEVKKGQIKIEKVQKTNESFQSIPSQIYNEIMNKNEKFDYKFYLNLDLENNQTHELIKAYKYVKLPRLKKLRLKHFIAGDQEVERFMTYSFPEKLNYFTFSLWCEKSQNITQYMDILKPCLQRTKKQIVFCDSIMNSKQLSQLVQYSKHCSGLWLNGCTINVDSEIDFGNEIPYNIKFLSFCRSGKPSKSDWATNLPDMMAIMKAISQSNLKNSLDEINIFHCGVSIEEVSQVLKNNGIENIKVTDNDIRWE